MFYEFEPLFYEFEPLFYEFKPLFYEFEPLFCEFEPLFCVFKPMFCEFEPMFYEFKPLFYANETMFGNVQKSVSKGNLLRNRFYILLNSVFHISIKNFIFILLWVLFYLAYFSIKNAQQE